MRTNSIFTNRIVLYRTFICFLLYKDLFSIFPDTISFLVYPQTSNILKRHYNGCKDRYRPNTCSIHWRITVDRLYAQLYITNVDPICIGKCGWYNFKCDAATAMTEALDCSGKSRTWAEVVHECRTNSWIAKCTKCWCSISSAARLQTVSRYHELYSYYWKTRGSCAYFQLPLQYILLRSRKGLGDTNVPDFTWFAVISFSSCTKYCWLLFKRCFSSYTIVYTFTTSAANHCR